ncbi:unnamed protein product [Choristocarpus tenellus]
MIIGSDHMASNPPPVPVIDITPLMDSKRSPANEHAVAQQVCNALASGGIFFAKGHGIKDATRQRAFDDAKNFFSLGKEEKCLIPAKKGGFTRGYIGFGGESGSNRLECKEAFSYGYPWPEEQPPENALQGPNIWPAQDIQEDGWCQRMIELFRLMVRVCESVSRGVSLGLGLEDEELRTLCTGGDTISLMRLFHYFPYQNHNLEVATVSSNTDTPSNTSSSTFMETLLDDRGKGGPGGGSLNSSESRAELEKISSSPHTDWGFLTCILQDDVGGLQYKHQGIDRWLDVPCVEDALVVNCGDYLSLFSGGKLRSPVHQVVTKGLERTSFVFFYYPSFDATLPVNKESHSSRTVQDSKMDNASTEVETCRLPTEYNTLLDLSDRVDLTQISFGEYLAMKWGGVFRE